MRVARRRGVNFFDNSESYGDPKGSAERIMGSAIRRLRAEEPGLWKRSRLVISTKIFWGGPDVNERFLSAKHIREGLEASLARLHQCFPPNVRPFSRNVRIT